MPATRLIHLADFARAEGGSFIALIRGVLAAAREQGWTTEAAFFESARECPWIADLEADGVRVHLAPQECRSSDRRLRAWLRDVVGHDGGRVVLHSHFTGFDVATALVAARRRDVVTVWHVHSVFPHDTRQALRAVVKFGVLGRAVDAFLCPADNIVDSAVRRGAPRSRAHFLPSGIVAEQFPLADARERAEAKQQLGLPADRAILLHFGWHWHLKGGDVFLQTVKALLDAGVDGIFAVERGGHEEYERYAEDLGIGDHVRVMGPVDDVRTLHSAADVVVCSSREEGMAYVVLEALCTGTPIVATGIPGHVFIGRQVEACVITGHDPAEIAAAIRGVIDWEPAVVEARARAARAWIVENLSVDVVAGRMIGAYDALLRGEDATWWPPPDESAASAADDRASSPS